MTAFSVRGVSSRGDVVVTVDDDRLSVSDAATGDVVWQRSGPGIGLELVGDVLDVDGAIAVSVHPEQINRATQLVTRYRNAVPAPTAANPSRGTGSGTPPPVSPRASRSLGTPPVYMNELCDRLDRAANIVIVLALLVAGVGVIGGIAIAANADVSGDHPNVAEGLGLLGAAVVQAAVLYLLGVWGLAWAARNRVTR